MPGSFFDSNTLLYVLSDDDQKARLSNQVIARGGTISVQVLNEVANVCRRKLRLPWPELRSAIAGFESILTVVPLTQETHHKGVMVAERYRLATYDAMIVASALLSDCDVLFSEDMQHGLRVEDTLQIINPFA